MSRRDLLATLAPLLKFLMRRFGWIVVTGKENLSGHGGGIIVCNHLGWADPLWLSFAAHPFELHYMAKKELFANDFTSWLMRQCRVFPVDRAKASSSTIRTAIDLLKAGKFVMVYPTGTRTRTEAELKRGAATIAFHAKARVIPAHYDGPETLRISHLFRRPYIRITFGQGISPPSDTNRDAIIDFSSQIATALVNVGHGRRM